MKWFLFLWAMPLALLGAWYGLSFHDINFGYRILSRELHDLVFAIYGNLLGVDPEVLPGLVLNAVLFDTALLFGLVLLKRKRHAIASALKALFGRRPVEEPAAAEAQSAASLSRAP